MIRSRWLARLFNCCKTPLSVPKWARRHRLPCTGIMTGQYSSRTCCEHIRKSDLDREALVLRNRSMTAAFHSTPLKHRVRRARLRTLALMPRLSARRTKTQRILIIRPDHLGDILLTTPAIRALGAALPDAEIHALVGPWSARVLASYSEVDTILTLPFPGFSREPKESLQSP